MAALPHIGGPLDWATLYGRDHHRPTDPAVLAAEIRRMYREGLKPRESVRHWK
jgi:hypothetical protein